MDKLSYYILIIGIAPSVEDNYIKTNLEALPSVKCVTFAKKFVEDARIGNIVYVSINEDMQNEFIREVNTPELYSSFGSFFYLKLMGIMKAEDIGKIIICQGIPLGYDMTSLSSMFAIYEGLESISPFDDGSNCSYVVQYNTALSGWQAYLDFNNKHLFPNSIEPVHIDIYNEYNSDSVPLHNTNLFSKVNNQITYSFPGRESHYPSFRKLTISSEFPYNQQNGYSFVRSRSTNSTEYFSQFNTSPYEMYRPDRRSFHPPPQYIYQYPSPTRSPRYPVYSPEDNYSEYDSADTVHTFNSAALNSIYDDQSPQEFSYNSLSSRDSSYYAPGVVPPYLSFGPRGVGIAPKFEGPPGGNLFVYNIPKSFQDIDLLRIFQPYGNILSAKVFIDKQNGKPKGFGFVSYMDAEMAQNAILHMNGAMVDGRKLKVQLKRKDVEKYMSS